MSPNLVARGGRDEQALVRRARDGSADAAEELVRRHWDGAHRAAYLIVQDASAAEDIVQESVLAALGALDGFDRRRPFRPWLHRIVVNRSLDWLRARGRRADVTGPGPDRAAPAAAGGLSDDVLGALAALDADARAAVVCGICSATRAPRSPACWTCRPRRSARGSRERSSACARPSRSNHEHRTARAAPARDAGPGRERRARADGPRGATAGRRTAGRGSRRSCAPRRHRLGRAPTRRLAWAAVVGAVAVAVLLAPPGRSALAWIGELVGIGEVGGPPTQTPPHLDTSREVVIDNGRAPDGALYELANERVDGEPCTLLWWPYVPEEGSRILGCGRTPPQGTITSEFPATSFGSINDRRASTSHGILHGVAAPPVADVRVTYDGEEMPSKLARRPGFGGFLAFFPPERDRGAEILITALDADGRELSHFTHRE